MKKVVLALGAVAAVCSSCSKENLNDVTKNELQESVLYVNLKGDEGTKSTGNGHGVQADDNNIQTLEIFVFRVNEGKPDDGVLDGYRKFGADELGDLTNLEIQTTTGEKVIYAVANSHRENWKGINTRALFEQQTALLQDDNLKNFIMTGSTQEQLKLASTVSLTIKRLVSRVQIKSVKTSFRYGPYDGMELTEVKAYIINAQGAKYIHNGLGDNIKLYNNGGYVEADAQACVMQGMIYDDFGCSINDNGYTVPHYFYCYENTFKDESEHNKFTRVVVEGKLNGVTYYYPIVLEELQRNCCYTLDITIKRPGSNDPSADVEKGTIVASIQVKDWEVLPETSIEF